MIRAHGFACVREIVHLLETINIRAAMIETHLHVLGNLVPALPNAAYCYALHGHGHDNDRSLGEAQLETKLGSQTNARI